MQYTLPPNPLPMPPKRKEGQVNREAATMTGYFFSFAAIFWVTALPRSMSHLRNNVAKLLPDETFQTDAQDTEERRSTPPPSEPFLLH
jgi:hypothetical protein